MFVLSWKDKRVVALLSTWGTAKISQVNSNSGEALSIDSLLFIERLVFY